LKGIGEWVVPEQGETIDNLGVNETIKNGFGMKPLTGLNSNFIQPALSKNQTRLIPIVGEKSDCEEIFSTFSKKRE